MDWIIHVLYNTQSSQKNPSLWSSEKVSVAPKAKRKSLPNNGLGIFRHDKKLDSCKSQVQVKRLVKCFSFGFPSATEQVSGARDPVSEVWTESVLPTSTRNWTSLPATSVVTYSTSHVTMTVFSEPLGGPRSCQSTTAMTSMGEFPYFLQSWGQSPPPVTHLLTNSMAARMEAGTCFHSIPCFSV